MGNTILSMHKKYHTYSLEEILLDEDFLHVAKSHYKGKNVTAWEQLTDSYPEKKELMEKAYLLINGIQIIETPVLNETIHQQFTILERTIRQRKKKRIIYWASSSAAGLLLLILSGLYVFTNQQASISEKELLLSQLENIETEIKDIRIIWDNNEEEIVEGNAVIKEEEDGSLLINQDKKIDSSQKTAEHIQVIVPKGKRSYVELRDGSKVWVNSGTKLLYPSQFDNKKREIYVDGEVYLEIAKDESSPFLVHTKNLDVKVLGTSFNVSAYQDDAFTEVVLVTGSVEINTNDNRTTRLDPDFCFHLQKDSSNVQRVDTYNYTCWKEGVMTFNGEELGTLFKRLSRYYDVGIYSSPEIDAIRYFGKLSLEEDIENVLHNISLIESIKYRRDGERIYINRR